MKLLRLSFLLFVAGMLSITCKQNDNTTVQTSATGTIRGHVTDVTGDTARTGAIVTTSPPTSSVSTDNSGNYTISDVSTGEYTVSAAWGNYTPGSITVEVSADHTTSADIHLGYVQVSTDGLVEYLPFNGNSEDESGHGNDGTLYGPTLINDRFGRPDAAFSFNGTSDYIDLGNSSSLNPTQEITIAAWINIADGTTAQQDIVSKHSDYNTNSQSYLLAWGDTPSQTVSFFVGSNGQYMFGRSSVAQVLPGSGWHFVVGVFKSNTNLDVYIDGQSANGQLNAYYSNTIQPTDSIPSSIAITSTPVRIGIWKTSATNWFDGGIDDIRIYNRALNTREIQALYHENGWTGDAVGAGHR